MKTIHHTGRDAPGDVVTRLRTLYPEYFLIYEEYWSLVDQHAAKHLQVFAARGQQELVRIVQDSTIDEFNQAEQLAKLAGDYRQVGHLNGMVTQLLVAENFALHARYSTPLIWCEIADIYNSIPFRKEAQRCVENANESLAQADTSDRAILPGDTSGRWIPEMGMDFYESKTRATSKTIEERTLEPEFVPSKTMELLDVTDEESRTGFAQSVTQWSSRFSSPNQIAPRLT